MPDRIAQFDIWQPGYGLATVRILKAGTSNLADVFTDEALTVAASNPQELLEKTENSVSYGKFAQPLYTAQPYELEINGIDTTGVQRIPLTSLAGIDASKAVATVAGGSQSIKIEDHLARRIDVRDYGVFLAVGETGASAATNTATLTAAIGAAGAAGGGIVEVPAGIYQFNTITLSAGVVLGGQGRGVTNLQSTQASSVVTIGGNRAGLARLTLDGVSQVGSSVGLYAKAKDEIVFDDCEIKRFETGAYFKGGERFFWRQFFVSDCVSGVKLHGDLDTGGGSDGEALQFGNWTGGKVGLCTTAGIEFEHVDLLAGQFTIESVGLDTNTGTAVNVVGARGLTLRDCWWSSNTTNLAVDDQSPETTSNTVIDLLVQGGSMSGGAMTLTGNLETVIFHHVDILDVDITLTTPGNNVLALDCREDDDTTIAGVATAWQRRKSIEDGASFGLTAGNAATKAWALALEPGQIAYLEAKVVGRRRNGNQTAAYHVAAEARRPGATLNYDTQTANFTVGNVLTGGTSGATARIIADSDSGTTGTLTLQDVEGTFIDNEIITDGAGGSATANGTQATSDCILIGPVAQVAYDAQSANFTVGATLTGGTSGATGTIVGDADGGTAGTLYLIDVVGTFIDNEAITDDGAAGAAVVNGLQSGGALTHIRPAARSVSLAYDGQTADFTVGQTIVGATSGATGFIAADADGGSTGTLTIRDAMGVFQDNEAIYDGAGGIAAANGQSVDVWPGVSFVANGPEIELRVTGATGHTVEWTADVQVVGS